jgi:hypothetical protein
MNLAAWGLSAYLFIIMVYDFIRVEKEAYDEKRKKLKI